MKRRFFLNLFFLFILLLGGSLQSSAEESIGQSIFQSLRCDSCHKSDQKSVGASLKEIAQTYSDSDKLFGFFKGTGKPLIESEKAGMMRGQLKKIESLSEEEKKNLADYILSFR